jgi:hypothetical protein
MVGSQKYGVGPPFSLKDQKSFHFLCDLDFQSEFSSCSYLIRGIICLFITFLNFILIKGKTGAKNVGRDDERKWKNKGERTI